MAPCMVYPSDARLKATPLSSMHCPAHFHATSTCKRNHIIQTHGETRDMVEEIDDKSGEEEPTAMHSTTTDNS